MLACSEGSRWRVCTFAEARLGLVTVTKYMYHVLVQMAICVPFMWNSKCCGESAPETIAHLCNYQCVESMRQKCSWCVVIKSLNKTYASLPRKNSEWWSLFGCYFRGIWLQLHLDMQISLNFKAVTKEIKHLPQSNSRTVSDLEAKPWIKSTIALQSHKLLCYWRSVNRCSHK